MHKSILLIIFFVCFQFIKLFSQSYLIKDTTTSINKEARMHIWWHWVEGEISKEGITHDLESMHDKKIVQATIINASLFKDKSFYVNKIRFNSNEWHEMFAWALKEANRLDIQIGVHNCDGWNSSGGPWIKPSQSMKVVSWSKTLISGSKKISITIPKPYFRENYYEDIATFAIPSKSSASSFTKSNPVFTLNDTISINGLADGCGAGGPILKWGDQLKFKLDQPITVNRAAIMAHKSFTFAPPSKVKAVYNLSYSTDGKDYKKAGEIAVPGVNNLVEVNFEPVTAQYFKIEFTEFPWGDSWLAYELAEIELLSDGENSLLQSSIPYLLEKTVNSKAIDNALYSKSAEKVDNPIQGDQIIDITKFITSNGLLEWKAPKGNWEIIRIGYTTTGFINKPATKEGEGLECDKMDSNAVNSHFSAFPQKLINTAGKFTGNSFKFMLIDSWECAFQNWTANFASEFKKRRGYKLHSFLPVLCGITINNAATTEAFLFDYRKTISELIEENYYKQFAKLCHKNNLEMHAEVIYGNAGFPPLDVLKSNQYCDMPIYEFWAGQNHETGLFDYKPQKNTELNLQASAALFYNKNILGAEAYTANVNYSALPWDLKQFGDRAFCLGINQLILHSFVHQPTNRFPGMTLGSYGPDFNRLSPWFKYTSSWMDYQSRVQQMLQKGQMHADILYYVGDQLPQFLEPSPSTTIPAGYQLHSCNYDVLKNKINFKNGKLNFGNVNFSILTLPANMGMELATLQRIAELLNDGATIYGPQPTKLLSMAGIKNNELEYIKLISQIWGKIDGKKVTQNSYGKGKVYWGESLEKVLQLENIKPDFTTDKNDSLTFLYTHRVEADRDIYFVFNQTDDPVKRVVSFKTQKQSVTEFNPINGETNTILDKKSNNSSTSFSTFFTPRESKIFVFENKEKIEKPIEAIKKYSKIAIKDLKAQIRFVSGGNDSVPSLAVNKLQSLTEFKDNKVKYFSGFANYAITFSIDPSLLKKKEKYYINLGKIGGTAEVILNGESLGTVWAPNLLLEITGKLKSKNNLNISVGNEFRNRIIGDLIEFGELKHIETSAGIKDLLKPNMPLKTSGLLGPIEIMIAK